MSDEIDEDLLRMQRAERRRKIGMRIFLTALVVIPFAWMLSPWIRHWQREREEQLTEVEKKQYLDALTQLEKVLREEDAAWKAVAKRELLEAMQFEGGDCRYTLDPPQMGAGDSYVQYGSIDGNYFGRWSLCRVGENEDVARCGGNSWALSQLNEERAQVEAGERDKRDLHRVENQLRQRTRDQTVVLLVEESTDPFVTPGLAGDFTYAAGTVAGRAYLHVDGEGFVCGAFVEAKNSKEIDVRYSYMKDNFLDKSAKSGEAARAALMRDLDVELRKAVAGNLQALGSAE
jgi:hypothetical protein